MKRAVIGWCLGGAIIVIGVCTASLSTRNRARGDELDQLERWCETQERRNELQRVSNRRAEWDLLAGELGDLQRFELQELSGLRELAP